MIDLLKALLLGVVEGITEWLPVSSTGHMILVNEFIKLGVSDEFREMFLVVVQLGAIMAVVVLYWNKLFPFSFKDGFSVKEGSMAMWGKILISSVPAAIVGILFDDYLDKLFYNYQTVSIMLILFGIFFILVETYNKGKRPKMRAISEITIQTAFIIGIFQMIAAVFPGTSRSGATIVGALLIGVARRTAAEYTFFLAVPAMLGASALKLIKFGFKFTGQELGILLVGMVSAFIVSVVAIKFLMDYIKKHDFKAFGWYRIVLGVVVLAYFLIWG